MPKSTSSYSKLRLGFNVLPAHFILRLVFSSRARSIFARVPRGF